MIINLYNYKLQYKISIPTLIFLLITLIVNIVLINTIFKSSLLNIIQLNNKD